MTSTASNLVRRHFATNIEAASAFFQANEDQIEHACRHMAARFAASGALYVFGTGAQATDAHHVAVEFVHPVIVGKRALPAIALTSDVAVLTGALRQSPINAFASAIATLGGPADIAFALCSGHIEPPIRAALAQARARGMLTLAVGPRESLPAADILFGIDQQNALIAQEVQETLYHVLWELVHVFFDAMDAPNPFGFPALSREERQIRASQDVRQSTRQKCQDICALRQALSASTADWIATAACAVADRVAAGGRILAFGNGGSATDAQDVAADCMFPALDHGRSIPALALTNDVGVLTAVANDVGYEHVFARQIEALGRPGDVALGFSTSGNARNVVRALEVARARGLLTVAYSGYDGGEVARLRAVDYCLVAPSDYVPRIQEAHATAWHALLCVVHSELTPPATSGKRALETVP